MRSCGNIPCNMLQSVFNPLRATFSNAMPVIISQSQGPLISKHEHGTRHDLVLGNGSAGFIDGNSESTFDLRYSVLQPCGILSPLPLHLDFELVFYLCCHDNGLVPKLCGKFDRNGRQVDVKVGGPLSHFHTLGGLGYVC